MKTNEIVLRKELEEAIERLIEQAYPQGEDQLAEKLKLLKSRKTLFNLLLGKWRDSLSDGKQNSVLLAEALMELARILDRIEAVLEECKPEGTPRPGEAIELTFDATRDKVARGMRRAARAAGVSIETANMITLFRDDAKIVGTSITGLEQLPATELPEGVLHGFIYLSVADSNIPPGFYTVRAQVTQSTVVVGSNPAVIQLIDQSGEVTLESPTTIDVSALTVPADRPPDFRTLITAAVDITGDPGECALEICFLCSNGYGVVCLKAAIPTCLHFSVPS